jgi:hypothetical protein
MHFRQVKDKYKSNAGEHRRPILIRETRFEEAKIPQSGDGTLTKNASSKARYK